MNQIVVDTNAAVDFMRGDSRGFERFRFGWKIFLPVHVVGELFFGAFSSNLVEDNTAIVDDLANSWTVIEAGVETARIYGRLRAREAAFLTAAKINDLWIAALCIEHDLPLLTNDNGFDHIPGLTVIHW